MASYADSMFRRAGGPLLTKVLAERDEHGAVREAEINIPGFPAFCVPEILSQATQEERAGLFVDEVTDTVYLTIESHRLPQGVAMPLSDSVTAAIPSYPDATFAVSPQRSQWGGAAHRVAFIRTAAVGLANHQRGNE